MEPNKDPASGTSVAFAGEHVVVTFKDKARPEEAVLVRELELNPGLLTYLSLVTKEYEQADFVTGNAAGWSKTLTRQSVLAICSKAKGLNFTAARMLLEYRAEVGEQMIEAGLWKESPSTVSAHAPAS